MKQIDRFIDENLISELISDLILDIRKNNQKWSKITKQTPALQIGYVAQHLSSLLTGYEGTRSGARGLDISDGTEVRSCNRVDQVDTCESCGEKVMRSETICSSCGSNKIKRNNDSKWLFTIRSEKELEDLLNTERVLLLLFDYPNFDDYDFNTIRIRAFEIYPKNDRHKNFCEIMKNYYYGIYTENLKKNPKKVPAPKNLWPDSFQFFMCNPIKIFECSISSVNENPIIESISFVSSNIDRSTLVSEPLPIKLLYKKEKQKVSQIKRDFLLENEKNILSLRD